VVRRPQLKHGGAEENRVAIFALILTIGLANFALGFALAVYFGHGPSWTDLAQLVQQSTRQKKADRTAPKAAVH
jgi:hypothetical protein